MTKKCKSIFNNFAKVFFVPVFFVALLVLSLFSINVFSVNDLNKAQALTTLESLNYSTDSLPTEYLLYKVDGMINNFTAENKSNYENLNKNVGNQKDSDICWAYSTLTALESTLYKKNLVPSGETINFSEFNMAYVSQIVNRGKTKFYGGDFELACEYLTRGEGPVYEGENESYNFVNNSSYNSSSSAAANYYKNYYYSTAVKSNYTVLETISFPSKESCSTQEEILELRNSIKSHIKNYGGVTASIHWNNDNFVEKQKYIYTEELPKNHMITLVGWDDNFIHTAFGKTYTGAYIAQNSYGTSYTNYGGYFYIMYDDAYVETNVNGFVRVGKDNGDTVEYNNLSINDSYINFNINGTEIYTDYSSRLHTTDFYLSNVYRTQNIKNQYLSQVKILTTIHDYSYLSPKGEAALQLMNPTRFYVYFLDGLTADEVAVNSSNCLSQKFENATKIKNKYVTGTDQYLFTANQTGYYTVEIDEELNITGDYFAIFVQVLSGGQVFYADNAGSISFNNLLTYQTISPNDSWTPYYSYDADGNEDYTKHCILPMEIKTKYHLSQIDYSATGYAGEYTGTNYQPNITVTEPSSYKISYSLTGENNSWSETPVTVKDCGEYEIYFKIEAPYYQTVTDSVEINITKKDIIVTPYSYQNMYYGNTEPLLVPSFSGNIETPSQPIFTGQLTREDKENTNVGKYQILLGSLELISVEDFNKDNYNLVFNSTPVYFEILKRPLKVNPSKLTKIYGESDPAELTYTYANVAGEESPKFEGSLKRVEGKDVGLYNVSIGTLSLIDNGSFKASNYEISLINNSNKFEILKRDLIVTPNSNQDKVYLEDDPELKYSVSNNVIGEEPKLSGALSRQEGEASGKYLITIGSLALVDNNLFKASNYNLVLSSTPVYFNITFGELTGCELTSVVSDYTGEYISLNPTNSDFSEFSCLYSLDNSSWQEQVISYKDVGTYNIYVMFLKDNYSSVVKQASITISPITLTVTPQKNQSKFYGDEDPELTYNYAGVVTGEVPNFDGSLIREEGKNVGSYLISKGDLTLIDGENFLAKNYVLSFDNTENISFAIAKRVLTVTPNAKKAVYGKAEQSLTYEISNTLKNEIPAYTGSLIREEGKNIGSYLISIGSLSLTDNTVSIQGSVKEFLASNYTLVLSSTPVYYEIEKANITIKVKNVVADYDGINYVSGFTTTISGDYNTDDILTFKFTCPVNAQTKKGVYPIILTVNHDNYNITVINGTYTVNYKTYTVSFKVLGNIVSYVSVEHFSYVSAQEVPAVSAEGYIFNNWKILNPDDSFLVVNPTEYPIVSETTFVASMELTLYDIIYNLNDGQFEGETLKHFTYVTDDFNLDSPVKTGYNFAGWYKNADFSGEPISTVTKGTSGNLILFAKWSIKIYQISLPIAESNSFNFVYEDELQQEYNSSFTFKVELNEAYSQSVKTLEVFVKWATSGEEVKLIADSNKQYKVLNIADDFSIVLYGINKNVYTISFIADGNVIKTVEKVYGDSLTETDYPEIPMKGKENYSDKPAEWDKKEEAEELKKITKNEKITAIYFPNIYTVTFVLPNGQKVKTTVTYGQKVSEVELKKAHQLGLFEYFVFDSSLYGVSSDTTINVTVGNNIYILYIVLAAVGCLIVFFVVLGIVKKKKRNKFDWWFYADEEDINPKSKKHHKK